MLGEFNLKCACVKKYVFENEADLSAYVMH